MELRGRKKCGIISPSPKFSSLQHTRSVARRYEFNLRDDELDLASGAKHTEIHRQLQWTVVRQ